MEMNKNWFFSVKKGDLVSIKSLWNETEKFKNQIDNPTTVLAVLKAPSENGVLFEVMTKGGYLRKLDAGWFSPYSDK